MDPFDNFAVLFIELLQQSHTLSLWVVSGRLSLGIICLVVFGLKFSSSWALLAFKLQFLRIFIQKSLKIILKFLFLNVRFEKVSYTWKDVSESS